MSWGKGGRSYINVVVFVAKECRSYAEDIRAGELEREVKYIRLLKKRGERSRGRQTKKPRGRQCFWGGFMKKKEN